MRILKSFSTIIFAHIIIKFCITWFLTSNTFWTRIVHLVNMYLWTGLVELGLRFCVRDMLCCIEHVISSLMNVRTLFAPRSVNVLISLLQWFHLSFYIPPCVMKYVRVCVCVCVCLCVCVGGEKGVFSFPNIYRSYIQTLGCMCEREMYDEWFLIQIHPLLFAVVEIKKWWMIWDGVQGLLWWIIDKIGFKSCTYWYL